MPLTWTIAFEHELAFKRRKWDWTSHELVWLVVYLSHPPETYSHVTKRTGRVGCLCVCLPKAQILNSWQILFLCERTRKQKSMPRCAFVQTQKEQKVRLSGEQSILDTLKLWRLDFFGINLRFRHDRQADQGIDSLETLMTSVKERIKVELP